MYSTSADHHNVDLRGAACQPHPVDSVAWLVGGLSDGEPRLLTGVAMGPVSIQVERHDQGVVGDVPDGWQDVIEFSCEALDDRVVAAGPFADDPGAQFALNPPGADWFRLRVHGRGRDVAWDLVVTEPCEDYLLVSWPEPPSPPRVLRAESNVSREHLAAEQQLGGA